MTEARITCICQNIILADLGLRLSQGQVTYVTELEAKKSQDLIRAARAGGVHIQYIQRAREIKTPSVGDPRRSPVVVRPTLQHTAQSTSTKPAEVVDVNALVKAQIDPLNAKIDTLLQAVSSGVVLTTQTIPQNTEVVDSQAHFIPSGLVKDAKIEIAIPSAETQNTGLDDASAALKARRRKNP